MRRALGWIVGVAALVGAVVLLNKFGGHAATRHESATVKPPAPPVSVTVERIVKRPVRRQMAMVGSLVGWEEIAVGSKVDGRIQRIAHDIGDMVKPGELLFEIDPADLQLAEAEAHRMVEWELAKLGLEKLPTGDVDLSALPTVERARAHERNAEARAERNRKSGLVATREERDQTEADLAMAKADLRQALLDARINLAAARQRQAAVEIVRQKLRDARVAAPKIAAPADVPEIVYAVAKRRAAPGEMVHAAGMANPELFRLVVIHPLKLEAALPERLKNAVRPGLDVDIKVEAFPGRTFRGTVERVNPTVDHESRSFTVQVRVPNPERTLSPGMFVKASVLDPLAAESLTVPADAVVSFAGVKKVLVVKDGAAKEAHVQVGQPLAVGQTPWVEVLGKIAAGDAVATSGQALLIDGSRVAIREPARKSATEPGTQTAEAGR